MLDFLQYAFMVRAFEAGLVLALVAPTIGIFFVVRRYTVMADTLSHVSLGGIALGLFFGIGALWSALVSCVVAVVGMEWLRAKKILPGDTIVALFLFGGLALGVALIGLHPGGGINVSSLLFGSVLTVTNADVVRIVVLGVLVLALTLWLWRPLFAASVDEDVAQAGGLPVRALNMVLALLGAVTIAISINVVGLLLIGALMVIPVLAAMQFRQGFAATLGIALFVSVLSVFVGLGVSFYVNLASGATVVLCSVAFFALAFVFSRFR